MVHLSCVWLLLMLNFSTTSSFRQLRFSLKRKISNNKIMHFEVRPDEEELFTTIRRFVIDEKLGTTVRVAGGWVRDRLLGLTGKNDIDLALDNMSGSRFASALAAWYEKKGKPTLRYHVVQFNPEKSKHLETATMRLGKFEVDAVQLRTESYTKHSRIPQIAFGTPLEDALRRDLTINSLFYNLNSGSVEDCTGRGLEDLRRGMICTPLPPLVTLQDDPLRAFRAVRFACRFNFSLDEDLERACLDPSVHSAVVNKVSPERVSQEMHAMLDHPTGAARAMLLLHRLRLLHCILPTPPKEALDVIPPVGILEGVDTGGVIGSARNGLNSNFNLVNMPDSAVNLMITSNLLSPDIDHLNETKKRNMRLLRYASISAPGFGLMYTGPSSADGTSTVASSNKRLRPMSFTRHICVHQFHTGKTDFGDIETMQQSAVAIRNQLLQIAASVWGETALHQPIVTTDLLHQESSVRPNLDRVQLGLILRHVTEAYFESALTLAIASIALEALHNYFTDVARKAEDSQAVGGAQWVSERATELLMRQVSASNIRKSVIEQAVLREGDEEEVAAWTHILSRCEQLREILMGTICDMQLQSELQRPSLPLSGHDIKKIFKKLPDNQFTNVMQQQAIRYLSNASACGKTEMEEFLAQKYPHYV